MFIPVSTPYIAPNSLSYVTNAIEKGEVSGVFGSYIYEFETRFAEFIDVKYTSACSNGTTALHLATDALGLMEGDEVLVSALTNMATFFAVSYTGATAVPVDVRDDFNIDPDDIERKITKNTKAIIIVHLFGLPCQMDEIMAIAQKYSLKVIEDCAEAHGATYKGKPVGSFGHISCFSFFANKILNTGEGGLVATNSQELASKMKSRKSLSYGQADRFKHDYIGFNYRFDNVKAALGCAQLDDIDYIFKRRQLIYQKYSENLTECEHLALPELSENENYKPVLWMYHINTKCFTQRNQITHQLDKVGIQTRPGFISYSLQPKNVTKHDFLGTVPNAERLSYTSFYVPTFIDIEDSQIEYICEKLTEVTQL